MHFEILVEDQSGKIALELLFPTVVGDSHTFAVHAYKGIGRIPKNMRDSRDPAKRILMDNLPKLLKGYGRAQAGRPHFSEVVILICDLDDRCLKEFREALQGILNACDPRPAARFCFAIEEGEAWFLGDLQAIRAAYPKANNDILARYENDSICGTWETLADAVYPGGSSSLAGKGWPAVGVEKSNWAKAITPHLDIGLNKSPSFNYFIDMIQKLTGKQ